MIHACGERGCNVLTMGEFCLEHEKTTRNNVSLLESLAPPVTFEPAPGVPVGATAGEAEHLCGRGGPLIST
jgi:hypothetical protein